MTIGPQSVFLITGASSGIGAALAVQAAQSGARIAIAARRVHNLEDVAERIRAAGGTALVLQADLQHEAECRQIVDATIGAFGRLDVLVNNAGRGNLASIEQTSTAQFDSIMRLNVYAPFWTSAQALPVLRKQNSGHIINVASIAGRMGFPYNAAYVAAKHAVVGFTAALRAELFGTNVFATVVNPAGVTTEWADVTEGGSISALYAAAVPRSRVIANERGLALAPLSRMMRADAAAAIIITAIEAGRNNDVFTHNGTVEQAIESVHDRMALEDRYASLFMAMQEVYPSVHSNESA